MNAQQQWIADLLADSAWGAEQSAAVFAPANIALCKYWGKRDAAWNLPVTDSLSISLGTYGSRCTIALLPEQADRYWLNGEPLPAEGAFAQRLKGFLDYFRGPQQFHYSVHACNTVPTAAGFASSASGFAALVQALDQLHGWGKSRRELSCLARLGSGSACRSLWDGFVHWHAGTRTDGSDSFGEPLASNWQSLRVGLLSIDAGAKPVSSREAMNRTVATSALYASWPQQVKQDMATIMQAITAQDVSCLGACAEQNALAMHATMMAARPSVLYWQPATVAVLQAVWAARAEGIPVFFTMDAGPNVKLLFEETMQDAIAARFPAMLVAAPWGSMGPGM